MRPLDSYPLGATLLDQGRCCFLLWAPKAERIDLHISWPRQLLIRMTSLRDGYFGVIVDGVEPGMRYRYRLDQGAAYPDPASRYQPEGVHGPSQVVDPTFCWRDEGWKGRPLLDYVLYELHVGTFTPEGTFDAVIPHLRDLARLGITVVELMPVAQFPGERNWGYDGAYVFAPQNSYGGPDGLRRLVDACHQRGLGVALDVVYNHLGPEGNYLENFGHYFTDRYRTPWGKALNFDDRHSDQVRRYYIENALYWVTDFHIDSLRLDAVHAIFDESARPFLRELAQAVEHRAERLGRCVTVIAESNKNDPRHVEPARLGGYELDALWNDDFHHALHVALTGEQNGYYQDFQGVASLARSFEQGFVYSGQYSSYRGRRQGAPSGHLAPMRFVVYAQNHDQVGNRAQGERLSALVDFESLKLAAAAVLLAPGVPLLFMGEEYGETAPFLYFVSHSDRNLSAAVRRGRYQEFQSFGWAGELPDPQAEETFCRSRLDHHLADLPPNKQLRAFYAELIRLRLNTLAHYCHNRNRLEVMLNQSHNAVLLRSDHHWAEAVACFHFGTSDLCWSLPLSQGRWRLALDSTEERWGGPGSCLQQAVVSPGTVSLQLRPRQVLVLLRDDRSADIT